MRNGHRLFWVLFCLCAESRPALARRDCEGPLGRLRRPTLTAGEARQYQRELERRFSKFAKPRTLSPSKIELSESFNETGRVVLETGLTQINSQRALNKKWGYSWVLLHEFGHRLIHERLKQDFPIYQQAFAIQASLDGQLLSVFSDEYRQHLSAGRIISLALYFHEVFSDYLAARVLNDPFEHLEGVMDPKRDFRELVSPVHWHETLTHHMLTPFRSHLWHDAGHGRLGSSLDEELETIYQGIAETLKPYYANPFFLETRFGTYASSREAWLWGRPGQGIWVEGINREAIEAVQKILQNRKQ